MSRHNLLTVFQHHRHALAPANGFLMVNRKTLAGRVHFLCQAAHMKASLQQFLCILIAQDFSLIKDDNVLKNIFRFLYNVCRDHKGTVCFRVFLHQKLIKLFPRDDIQPGSRLVKKCDIRLARKPHDDRQHGNHSF